MTIKQIDELIEIGESLKLISQAYGELAIFKLKKIRSDVERNRSFVSDIAQVYFIVKKIGFEKGVLGLSTNSKTISLLLTSNYRFYGSINNNLVNRFIVNTAKINTDRIVIGHTGVDSLKSMRYFHSFTPLIFKTDIPKEAELKQLIDLIKNYSHCLVFYAQFKSVLTQIPIIRDVTQTQVLLTKAIAEKQEQNTSRLGYILEPELKEMLQFFELQIKTLLIEQTFLESELSRTASRVIAMDQAQRNANDFIADNKKLILKEKRSITNNQILETVAGLLSYNKHKGTDAI